MKKTIFTLLLILIVIAGIAQKKPKQHVFYDTVKTVETRVDYSPDTIPVYFKELVFMKVKVYDVYNATASGPKTSVPRDSSYIAETWQDGFVIWQTYHKRGGTVTGTLSFSDSYSFSSTLADPYYKTEYVPSPTMPGVFLYADRKTVVKNKVIYSIKR